MREGERVTTRNEIPNNEDNGPCAVSTSEIDGIRLSGFSKLRAQQPPLSFLFRAYCYRLYTLTSRYDLVEMRFSKVAVFGVFNLIAHAELFPRMS